MSINRKKLAVIHIAKKTLGMNDDAYRALLYQACGVRSAKDIQSKEAFRAVMRALERAGYRGLYTRAYADQWAKAKVLWGELYACGAVHVPSDRALSAFVNRMNGAETRAGMSRVIEHLKKWIKRVQE